MLQSKIWGAHSSGLRGMNFTPSTYLYNGKKQTYGPTTLPSWGKVYFRSRSKFWALAGPTPYSKRVENVRFNVELLHCSYPVTGDAWKPLVCFWVGSGGTVGTQDGAAWGGAHTQPETAGGKWNEEKAKREAGVTSWPPSTIALWTLAPGTASWLGLRHSVPCHLQPASDWCLSAL